MATTSLLDEPLTSVTQVSTYRLVQRDDIGHVLWVLPDIYPDRQMAERAARGLNERRPRPDQWWVAAPEGRPA